MATLIFHNLDQVHKWIKESVLGFGFHLDGETTETLGEECAEDIAVGIRLRSVTENSRWPANEPKYAEWKEDKYGVPAGGSVNLRTSVSPGSMLGTDSLKGTRTVSQHEVVMEYGMDLPPTYSMTGYINNDDVKRTDRQKASYAIGANREFYFLDDQYTNQPVFERVGRRLHKWLEERNQGGP